MDSTETSSSAADGEPTIDDDFAADSGDEQQLLKEWATFFGIMFAVLGVGIGLTYIIINAVDQATAFGQISLLHPTMFTALFVGAAVGWRLNVDDQTAYKVAGASMAAASVAATIPTTILRSTTTSSSLDFGGLLINLVIIAIFVAAVAAGGVWAARNYAPSTLVSEREPAGPTAQALD